MQIGGGVEVLAIFWRPSCTPGGATYEILGATPPPKGGGREVHFPKNLENACAAGPKNGKGTHDLDTLSFNANYRVKFY